MCGTKTTNTQNQQYEQKASYDPQSLANYHTANDAATNTLTSYMQDPYKNGFFNQTLAMGQRQIGSQTSTQYANLRARLNQGGWGNGTGDNPAFAASMNNQIMRANSGNQATMLNSLLSQYGTQRLQAAGMANALQPLNTGQTGNSSGTSTSQTSGLGTWLPQVLGAAVGGVASAATGGLMGGGGTSSGAGYGSGNNNIYPTGGVGGGTFQMGVPYNPTNSYLSGYQH